MKVGDYCRTKDGIITKIIWAIEEQGTINKIIFGKYQCDNKEVYSYPDEFKSSPNIIDLIELRDIVELYEESWFDNGVEYEDTGYYEVLAYTMDRKEIGVRNKNGEIDWYPAENLRGIITYEQINVMEYKLEVKDE